MAVIAGMETATVDDIQTHALPMDAIAKGVEMKENKSAAAKNAVADAALKLQMELRDRQEDWDTFNSVANEMSQEMKELEETIGGDWSQVNTSEIAAIAGRYAKDNRLRQLQTAKLNADAYEQSYRQIEAAGGVPLHLGVDPRNLKLYDEDGNPTDFHDFKIYNQKEVYDDIDKLSEKLGKTVYNTVKLDSSYNHLPPEKQKALWYDMYMKMTFQNLSNHQQAYAAIQNAVADALNYPSVQIWSKKLKQDFMQANPNASEELAHEHAMATIGSMIFNNTKKKLHQEYKEDLTYTTQMKPQPPGSRGGGSGGSGPKDPKWYDTRTEINVTRDGTTLQGLTDFSAASHSIETESLNIYNLGKDMSKITMDDAFNLNVLNQFMIGVPLAEGDVSNANVGFNGGLYNIEAAVTSADGTVVGKRHDENSAVLPASWNAFHEGAKHLGIDKKGNASIPKGIDLKRPETILAGIGTNAKDPDSINMGDMLKALTYKYYNETMNIEGADPNDAYEAAAQRAYREINDISGGLSNYAKYVPSMMIMNNTEDATDGSGYTRIDAHPGLVALRDVYESNEHLTDLTSARILNKLVKKKLSDIENLKSNPEFIKIETNFEQRRDFLISLKNSYDKNDLEIRQQSGLKKGDFYTVNVFKGLNKNNAEDIEKDRYKASSIVTGAELSAMFSELRSEDHGYINWAHSNVLTQWIADDSNEFNKMTYDFEPKSLVYTNIGLRDINQKSLAQSEMLKTFMLVHHTDKFTSDEQASDVLEKAAPVILAYEKTLGSAPESLMKEIEIALGDNFKNLKNTILGKRDTSSSSGAAGTLNRALKGIYYDATYYKKYDALSSEAKALIGGFLGLTATYGAGLKMNPKFKKGAGLWDNEYVDELQAKIKNGSVDINDLLVTSVGSDVDARRKISKKKIEIIKDNPNLRPEVKNYFSLSEETKMYATTKMATYWGTNTGAEGKHLEQFAEQNLLAALSDTGVDGDPLMRTEWGKGLQELINSQELRDLYNSQKGDSASQNVSFEQWIIKMARPLGLGYDIDHNGKSGHTLAYVLTPPGHEGKGYHFQIAVSSDNIPPNLKMGIGYPSYLSRYGDEAHKSLQANDNMFFQLDAPDGRKVTYYRAHTDLTGLGEGGTTVKRGQFYILGDGTDINDLPSGTTGLKAKVFSNAEQAMAYHETMSLGDYAEEIRYIKNVYMTAKNLKGKDQEIYIFNAMKRTGTLADVEKLYYELLGRTGFGQSGGGASGKK